MKNIKTELNNLRKQIISELKNFAKTYGKIKEGNRVILFEDANLCFTLSNTEDLIYSFNNKGIIEIENCAKGTAEVETLGMLSTDLLFCILENVNKNKSKFVNVT